VSSASHLVYLSLGSNIEREVNIRACLDELTGEFGLLSISSVYESESVGFRGDPFFNLVVGLRTCEEINSLANNNS
jgi:2-amino-4-hydroxy-6-hydroxymethyldihydropteridine diphosphokinase